MAVGPQPAGIAAPWWRKPLSRCCSPCSPPPPSARCCRMSARSSPALAIPSAHAPDSSFPSDHGTAIFTFALAFLFWHRVWSGVLLMIVAVGIARHAFTSACTGRWIWSAVSCSARRLPVRPAGVESVRRCHRRQAVAPVSFPVRLRHSPWLGERVTAQHDRGVTAPLFHTTPVVTQNARVFPAPSITSASPSGAFGRQFAGWIKPAAAGCPERRCVEDHS